VRENLVLGTDLFLSRDHKKIDTFWSSANDIDRVNDKISAFLKRLYNESLSKEDSASVSSLVQIAISLKRVSNRTKGFAKMIEDAQDRRLEYPKADVEKLTKMYDMTMLCFDNMFRAFNTHDIEAIGLAVRNADETNSMREKYKSEHLERASVGGYCFESGIMLSEAARHFARISHNIKSVAESISVGYIAEEDEIDAGTEVEEAMKRR